MRVLQIEPLANLFHGLVDRIPHFLNVDLAHDVKRIVLRHKQSSGEAERVTPRSQLSSFPCRAGESARISGRASPDRKRPAKFAAKHGNLTYPAPFGEMPGNRR